MGTNYYWVTEKVCGCCGSRVEDSVRHIGKSSVGWTFALHVYPENDINTLEDWFLLFMKGGYAKDEYEKKLAFVDMLDVIVNRDPCGRRRDIDKSFCIGYGKGTWDYCMGDFN